ncbi:MAG: dienelactone hydrolase family protein [Thermoanaerobaculales bacterium]|nr:dienelactone hydrolase family protein [Thermoanaerobaculales bacterium]
MTPVSTPADRPATHGSTSSADPRYRYPHEQIRFENHVLGRGDTANYSERLLTFPSIGDNGQQDKQVRARYFRSELEGPRPLVIVLPIYARFTYPSRKMVKFLQKKSDGEVHVLDVEGKDFLIDWLELADTDDEETVLEIFRRGIERERVTVIDVRRLIDWAKQRPEIDASRVALVGFSRGAIVAGIVATQEPRLAATVLMMGGAHPDRIIARCDGVRTSAVQGNVERRFGWDRDEFERRIHDLFAVVDSANYPGRVDPETVLIFEAGKDECIPPSSREALKQAMGNPMVYTIDRKHRWAFLDITPLGGNWLCHRTWEFLRRRFERADGL